MSDPDVTSPEKTYRDALLWIGDSYADILCENDPPPSAHFCLAGDPPRRLCYVHEAESRGCCRKVPAVPDWIEPGQSRIFLVHHGKPKEVHRGSIFGYFVVQRIEVISDDDVYDGVKQGKLPWSGTLHRDVADAVLQKVEPPATWNPETVKAEVREAFGNRKRTLRRRMGEATTVRPRRPSPPKAADVPGKVPPS